jgi:adenosine deaminase
MVEAGVLCSISTDDPAMFDTDLARDHQAAVQAGCTPEQAFVAGLAGALCDDGTRAALRQVHQTYQWSETLPEPEAGRAPMARAQPQAGR